jgi:hypothetical protein
MTDVRNVLRGVGIPIVLIASVVTGCATRSISDSGYHGEPWYQPQASGNPSYKSELNEFDVLGISPTTKITQEEIDKAFASKQDLSLPAGSSLMLIQSGATIPDEAMVKAMGKHYSVSVFSGLPVSQSGDNYAMSLRLAAAKGGYERIVIYWGLLETAQKGLVTKTVSWVPFAGGAIPNEKQEMRIRLKVAVIHVKSGQWDMFSPEPFQNTAVSARQTREASDQGQVAMLKAKAYEAAAEEFVKRYSK